jgi:hypothetical protein
MISRAFNPIWATFVQDIVKVAIIPIQVNSKSLFVRNPRSSGKPL